LVVLKWGWSYLTFARGSRLIQGQGWRSYPDPLPSLAKAESERWPPVSGTWVAAVAAAPPLPPHEREEEGRSLRHGNVSLAP
jgi:hypothetical protein